MLILYLRLSDRECQHSSKAGKHVLHKSGQPSSHIKVSPARCLARRTAALPRWMLAYIDSLRFSRDCTYLCLKVVPV